MGKAKKSTKKFLQQKASGKVSKIHKKAEWKRTKNDPQNDGDDEADDEQMPDIAKMDVDEFLAGNFLTGEKDSEDEEEDIDADSEDDAILGSDSDDDVNSDEEDEKDHKPNSPSSLSESDDEDQAGDEKSGVRGHNKKLSKEVEAHKKQLEQLRQADPEFYEYLKSTDQELLDFGQEEEDSEDDDIDDEVEEEEDDDDIVDDSKKYHDGQDDSTHKPKIKSISEDKKDEKIITMALVDAWTTAAKENNSLSALRNLIRAYRVSCHYGDTEENIDEGMRVGSSAVYNRLMMFVLKEADHLFKTALGVVKDKEGNDPLSKVESVGVITKLARWKKVEPLVKSYLGNTLHLLGQMTDANMLAFILRRVRSSVAFLAPFAKIQRRYLKSALHIFGASPENAPRVHAILLVRSMALTLPLPTIDACLKGVYRALSNNAKFVNATSAPHINFMSTCVVELYGIDASTSYRIAFGFIRQLAVLMRQALTSKSKESYKQMYCWQTITCLEVWASVLSAHAADMPELRPLVYPVAQLLLGTARLVPTPSYFPLRLRCARALNRLAQSTGVYIPVGPVVLEILQWGDLGRAPRRAPGDKVPEILLQLRIGKSLLRSSACQEEIVEQSLELLAVHLSQWGYHCAFPELSHLPLTSLKRFSKSTKVERFRTSAKQLINAIERNVAFVGRHRDQVEFSPKDASMVASFLEKEAASGAAPIAQHATTLQQRAQQRYALRAAKDVDVYGNEDDSDDEEFGKKKEMKTDLKRNKKKVSAEQEKEEEEESDGGIDDIDDDGMNEDDEDRIEGYQLSDDEEEEEEEPIQKEKSKGRKKNSLKK